MALDNKVVAILEEVKEQLEQLYGGLNDDGLEEYADTAQDCACNLGSLITMLTNKELAAV